MQGLHTGSPGMDDRSGASVILVVGRPLRLPWDFAGDDLGTCTRCGAFVRYRAAVPGILSCPACIPGAEPGDVWVV
jgi:hypothetical protein